MQLRRQLNEIQKDGSSVTAYLNTFKTIADTLMSIGE
jgi:hypothetical protein